MIPRIDAVRPGLTGHWAHLISPLSTHLWVFVPTSPRRLRNAR